MSLSHDELFTKTSLQLHIVGCIFNYICSSLTLRHKITVVSPIHIHVDVYNTEKYCLERYIGLGVGLGFVGQRGLS